MIIVDLNQISISNLMMQIGNHTNMKIEEDLVRHMILNTIRLNNQKFRDQYGDIVIACDNKRYWRREVFPYYKANRRKAREKSDLDWNAVFECLRKIKEELKEHFPYKVIDVDGAEADDVIGTLVHKHASSGEQILILSGDKDFVQLQDYQTVKQYDPIRKKYIEHNNPQQYTKEHVIKGDPGDGIPNFLSQDNCLVVGARQKPIRTKLLEQWVAMDPRDFCNDEQLRNYKRNDTLINLQNIPSDVKERVTKEYEQQENKPRSKLLDYFIQHRLKNLMEHLNEF